MKWNDRELTGLSASSLLVVAGTLGLSYLVYKVLFKPTAPRTVTQTPVTSTTSNTATPTAPTKPIPAEMPKVKTLEPRPPRRAVPRSEKWTITRVSTHRQEANIPCEDRIFCDPENKMFAVFDGHGGDACSDYIADRLPAVLKTELVRNKNITEAVTGVFTSMDARFMGSGFAAKSAVLGSCGIISFIRNDIVYTACVGDSRSVIGRRKDGKVEPFRLNEDQNSKNPTERELLSKRTTDPHPFRAAPDDNSDGDRVGGVIMVTRAFGDAAFKKKELSYPPFDQHVPYLTVEPVITENPLQAGDEFMVVSSDGLYDFLSVEQVVDFVAEYTEANKGNEEKLSKVSEYLAGKVLEAAAQQQGITVQELIEPNPERKKRMDDTSIIVVYFQQNTSASSEERFDNDVLLVTGPNGELGSRVVRELAAIKGAKIRAATTNPKTQKWPDNVEEHEVDPTEKDSVLEVSNGATIGIIIPPVWSSLSAVNHMYTFGLTAQRRGAGKHLIKIGQFNSGGTEKPLVLKMHGWADAQLRKSPIPYTIINPNVFMQDFYKFWGKSIREKGEFYVLSKATKVSFIDARDIACAVAIVALDTEAHDTKEYNVTGGEALSYDDVAALLAAALRRPVAAVEVTVDELKKKFAESCPSAKDFVIGAWADLWTEERDSGKAAKVTNDFEQLVGRKPLSFATFVEDHKARFLGTFEDPNALVQDDLVIPSAATATTSAAADQKPIDINGTWEVDLAKSDKFEPFLEAVGVGFIERKMMGNAKIKMIYQQNDERIIWQIPTPVGTNQEIFLLNGTKENKKAAMPIGNVTTWTTWGPDKQSLITTYEVHNSNATGIFISVRTLVDPKTMEFNLKFTNSKSGKVTINRRLFHKIA